MLTRFVVLSTLLPALLGGCSDGVDADASGGEPDATPDTDAAADDTASEADVTAPQNPLLADRLLTIAHRGGGGMRPEETMLAYQNAVDLGVDVLETDVHFTKDKVIICMHDETVDRTTDGGGAIKNLTFEELRALDAGYHFTTDGGQTYPYRGQGAVVATMDELLTAFPDTPWVIEVKPDDLELTDALLALLDAHDVVGHVGVGSVHHDVMLHVRETRPDVLTGYDALEQAELLVFDAAADPEYVAPARILQTRYLSVDADVLATTRRLGVKVQVWTVNDPADMQAMMELGVDGIMTDYPATLVELVHGGER